MTIAQINNIFLLIGCGAVAYLFYLISQYLFEISERKFDELAQRKEDKLKQSAYDYYYTMAINAPETLATELANARINLAKKKGQINDLYSKWRAC